MPGTSSNSSVLKIKYVDLADTPRDRLDCLRAVCYLIDRQRGLCSRQNLKLSDSAWRLLLDWISHTNPNYLRVENENIRILQEYTGHVLIGTTHLVSDLDETLESVSEPPSLKEIWLAAKQTIN